MPTRIEVEEVLKGLFADLRDTTTARREIERDLKSRFPEIAQEITSAASEIYRLQGEADRLDAVLLNSDSQLADELSSFSAREAELRNSIKQAAYTISPEEADSGLSINGGDGWRLSVSKVQTKISYKTEDLLRDFPELASKEVDGDPLVIRAIDSAILSRLCASGTIDPSELGPYRVVTKERNPSVRFTTGEDNE